MAPRIACTNLALRSAAGRASSIEFAPADAIPRGAPVKTGIDSAAQALLAVPGTSFEGPGLGMTGFVIAGAPPDPTLAVGPNHIVAWVNSQYAIFDKSGNKLLPGNGFVNGNTLFAGLGNLCETTNRGDPIVQYDRMADRWFLSQFAFNANVNGDPIAPYLQCIAISTTNDPAGTYYRYTIAFDSVSPNGFNDYAKLGIWPDAYYTSYNIFGGSPAGANTGAALCASDRTRMLAGLAAATLCAPVAFYGGGAAFLPADMDGSTLPTDTTQGGIFMRQSTAPALRIIKLKPDFSASTVTYTDGFGGAAGSFVNIPLGTTTRACIGTGGACIAQPGTTTKLDTLGDRLMYRLAYRNRDGVDSLIVNQSVDPDGVGARGATVRWYEIRSPFANPPTLYQTGTYDPDASSDRWMGSMAMDKNGNILMGYSIVNAGTGLKPSIAITGRLQNDPLNQMQAESVVITGTGSQTSNLTRWGDYTTMQVDPSDDATFWYINQYLATDGSFNWHTRISSYKFPTVPDAPTNVTGTPGNTQVAVSWTAPVSNGGSAITGYQVQVATSAGGTYSNATGCPTNSTTPACTATGLTNGTPYFFKVAAINGIGTGAYSSASSGVTPATVPDAPTNVTGTAGNSQIAVSWTAPVGNGGSAITGYQVQVATSAGGTYSNATGCPTNSTTPSCTATGLTNGTPYFFKVAALNGIGTGAYSSASSGVTPATVPDAPTNVTGTAGNTQVAVSWTAPVSNGGSAITGYQVQVATSASGPYGDAAGCPTNSVTPSCAATGLTNGTPYFFKVAALNSVGMGAYSAASPAVTPSTFTDDPLTAGVTSIRAVHVTELRSRIDALRLHLGLAAFVWTDASLNGVGAKVVHIAELRVALQAAYDAAIAAGLSVTRPSFTDDPLLQQQTIIKAIHIAELRSAVLALEALP